jgi:hypothetical protein
MKGTVMTDYVDSPALAKPGLAVSSVVDWPAIIAGAIVAAAVSFVATTFSSAIGLTVASPYAGPRQELFFIAAGLWLVFIVVSSFAAGGYITGRLRRRVQNVSQHETDIRDGIHGLTMWAVAVVVGGVLATASLGSASKTGTSSVQQAATGLSDRYVDLLLRGDGDTRRGGPGVTEETRAIVSRLVLENPAGNFSTDDKAYLTNVISSSTALHPSQASDRVVAVATEMKADANKARKIGVFVAFLSAATLAVAAATAWAATRVGGHHRDGDVDLSHLVRLRR